MDSAPRTATVERTTKETTIRVTLTLDGAGTAKVSTGLGFLDHMLDALARHGGFDLEVAATGDTHIDDHHTVEDVALTLGAALDQAVGDKRGIRRFGSAYAPLDEALARTVVDLSGRPWPEIQTDFVRETLGTVATENITHFFESLAIAARMTLHVDVIRGRNDHHKAEAAFKSLALALRDAVAPSGRTDVPSTKGSL